MGLKVRFFLAMAVVSLVLFLEIFKVGCHGLDVTSPHLSPLILPPLLSLSLSLSLLLLP